MPSSLIRLVYASRSAVPTDSHRQGLDPAIARILARSRKNNARRQIVGGLLFGDGYFMQCLEGEAEAVDALYRRIEADPRHRDVTVLSRRPILRRSFGAWSMKYVPGEQAFAELLARLGLKRFDPYTLDATQLHEAVLFLQEESDAVQTLPGEFAVTAPNPLPAPTLEPLSPSRPVAPARGTARTPEAAAAPSGPGRRLVLLGALLLAAAGAYLLLR